MMFGARQTGKSTPEFPLFPATDLIERMTFGELPGVATAPPERRADVLKAYCLVYLEEELRRESLIKDWAAFSRFLALAASESGRIINCAKISKDAGVSQPTVKSYYQLLEDMLQDARHLLAFLEEHPKTAKQGFIICRCHHPLRLHDKIMALPWFCL